MNFESLIVRCQEKADFGKGHKKSERRILAISFFWQNVTSSVNMSEILSHLHLLSKRPLEHQPFENQSLHLYSYSNSKCCHDYGMSLKVSAYGDNCYSVLLLSFDPSCTHECLKGLLFLFYSMGAPLGIKLVVRTLR